MCGNARAAWCVTPAFLTVRGCLAASTGVATPQRVCGNARVGWRVIQDGFKGACLAVTAGAGLEQSVCAVMRVLLAV